MISLLFLLFVASVLGSLGALIAGKRDTGCLVSIMLGFIGALVGRWLSQTLDVPDPWNLTIRNVELPVFWTIAGSALFVALLTLLSGRRGN